MTTLKVSIPKKLRRVFSKKGVRYRCSYGGRGSAKTRTFAKMAAIRGLMAAKEGRRGVVLCGREYMNSLDDSSMSEVKEAIASEPWLSANYDIGEKYIRTRDRRVSFKFCGLTRNLDSIKSKSKILLLWVDEAENVSEKAWVKVTPTVREAGSEIWVTWNPEKQGSPVDMRFRNSDDDGVICVEMNYSDNHWFPDVLEGERLRDQKNLDPSIYAHIWEGAYLEISDAQILRGKYRIEDFTVRDHWDGPYFGADWGFSVDPTTLIKSWIYENKLYVEHEAYGVGVEIDHTPDLFREVPGSDSHVIRADSARPETISYMRRAGFNVRGAEKGKGSVEDGIGLLRRFDEIIIHPRCRNTSREARLWSYKVDKLSGDVLPVIAPGYDHTWDAVRYALEPIMKKGNASAKITTPQEYALNRSW
jgi:phage terminase large subunit